MKRIFAAIFLITFVSCSDVSSIVEQTSVLEAPKAVQSEKQNDHTTTYKIACEYVGGDWTGISELHLSPSVTAHDATNICNLPSSDAGKPCDTEYSCEGRCIISMPGSQSGMCSANLFPDSSQLFLPIIFTDRQGEPISHDLIFSEKLAWVQDFTRNLYKWETHRPQNYEYDYRLTAFVSFVFDDPLRTIVTDGQISALIYEGEPYFNNSIGQRIVTGRNLLILDERAPAKSIEALMTDIHRTLSWANEGDILDVTYNSDLGYPEYFVSDSPRMYDVYNRSEILNFKITDHR